MCSLPGVTVVLQGVLEVEEVRRVEGDLYSKMNIIDMDESDLLMAEVRGGAVKKVERRYVGGNSTCLTILRLQATAELLRAG